MTVLWGSRKQEPTPERCDLGNEAFFAHLTRDKERFAGHGVAVLYAGQPRALGVLERGLVGNVALLAEHVIVHTAETCARGRETVGG